jgi:hypothetical protein
MIGWLPAGLSRWRSDPRLLAFAVPLIAKRRATDWDRVVSDLQMTVASLLNQTDPNFRILIGAGDDLRGLLPRDRRIEIIKVEEGAAPAEAGRQQRGHFDAGHKKSVLTGHGARHGARFIMYMDADDLSNRLVEIVRSIDHPFGYILRRGFVMNCRTGLVLDCPSDHIAGVEGFDQFCGSSIVITYPQTSRNDPYWHLRIMSAGHQNARSAMIRSGSPAIDLHEELAIYRLNTGINASQHGDNDKSLLDWHDGTMQNINMFGYRLDGERMQEFGCSMRSET